MGKFYITFGQVHKHNINGQYFDKDVVCEIQAEDEHKARQIAFEKFGTQWFTSYPESEHMIRLEYFPRGIVSLKQ
jgi:hypothetical protein